MSRGKRNSREPERVAGTSPGARRTLRSTCMHCAIEPLDRAAQQGLARRPGASRARRNLVCRLARYAAPGSGCRCARRLCDAIVRALGTGRGVVAALGGHVVKTGCGAYLVDWIDRGILTGLALNGSAAIHDLELAIAGKTSEDVGSRLMAGTFGFARETSELFAAACDRAAASRSGLGRALGELVARAWRAGPRVFAPGRGAPGQHSAFGPRGHRHRHRAHDPRARRGRVGQSRLDDFRALCGVVAGMAGGVWLNIGSAVVMPEVFLKAVAIARNLGHSLDGMTTANLDFDQKYRGLLNVLERPGAQGIALTGHHEIMIPLLHAAVLSRIEKTRQQGTYPRNPAIVANGEAR